MITEFIVEIWNQFGAINDQLTSLAAIVAAVLAYAGLKTWRLQLKGTSEYTLAKEVLKAVFRVREGFKHVRNPAIFGYEYPESMLAENGYLKDECRAEGTAHVYQERFKVLNEAFKLLEDHSLDAQVEWGAKFSTLIMPLRKLRAELLVTLQDYVHAMKPGVRARRTSLDEKREERSVMYYLGEDASEHDKFTPEINKAILAYETELRPIIGGNRLTSRWSQCGCLS
jgi:hypothetical protein